MKKFKQLTSIIGCTILLLILLVYWTPSASAGATPDKVLYRPNINELDSETVDNLKYAIMKMHQLPDDDPRSWEFQAKIHGTYDTSDVSPLWNTCQHANQYFLPWHRAYLYHFEKILREVAKEGAVEDCNNDPDCDSDDPGEKYSNLTVPYWSYDDGDTEIPTIFRVGPECTDWTNDEDCNPLYVGDDHRDSGMNRKKMPDALKEVPTINDLLGINSDNALEKDDYCHIPNTLMGRADECPDGPSFQSFGGYYAKGLSPDPTALDTLLGKGSLEFNPHDLIHSGVGGGRPTIILLKSLLGLEPGSCDEAPWMSDPNCSPLDPIFWIHHANIDRLWAKWNKGTNDPKHYRPPHDNPDNIWNDEDISFVGKDGEILTYHSSDFAFEDTRCYGYTYEISEEDHAIPGSCPEILPIPTDPMKGRIRRGQSEEIQEGIRTVLERISKNLNRLNRLEEGRSVKIGVDIKTKVLEKLKKLKQEGPAVLKEGPAVLKIKNVHYLPGSPIYRVNITKNNGENKEFVGFISLFGFPEGGDLKFELGEKLKAMIDNGLQVELEEFDPVERKVNPTLPLKLDRMPTLPLKLDGMPTLPIKLDRMPTIDEIPMIGFDSVEIEAIE